MSVQEFMQSRGFKKVFLYYNRRVVWNWDDGSRQFAMNFNPFENIFSALRLAGEGAKATFKKEYGALFCKLSIKGVDFFGAGKRDAVAICDAISKQEVK